MKAMIFAAGLGTRLAPLTDTCPKALIEVGGVPMLGRVLDRVIDAGASEVVVNVHWLAPRIEEYLSSRTWPVTVRVSDESDRLLDTGGGVLKAASMLGGDDEVVLYNADILTDFPLKEMIRTHRASDADATLLTSSTRKSSRKLLFDEAGRLRGWRNLTTGELRGTDAPGEMAFGGVHIISPAVIEALGDYARANGEKFSMTPFYIAMADRLKIQSYEPSEPYRWVDIGKPETLAEARKLF